MAAACPPYASGRHCLMQAGSNVRFCLLQAFELALARPITERPVA